MERVDLSFRHNLTWNDLAARSGILERETTVKRGHDEGQKAPGKFSSIQHIYSELMTPKCVVGDGSTVRHGSTYLKKWVEWLEENGDVRFAGDI
jgi:hypothetical protein